MRYFKANDAARRAVAEQGWRRTHEMFDATRVARYLVERAFGEPLSEAYPWPTEVC